MRLTPRHVRSVAHFAAQGQPLRDAETVLLVDDGKRKVFELHLVLDHRMRSDHQRRFAAGNAGQCLAPLLRLLAAGQPGGFDAERLQPGDQLSEMLLSENFGRRHQRALPARVHAVRRCQRGHHGFS